MARIGLIGLAIVGTAATALAAVLFWLVVSHPVLVAQTIARGF